MPAAGRDGRPPATARGTTTPLLLFAVYRRSAENGEDALDRAFLPAKELLSQRWGWGVAHICRQSCGPLLCIEPGCWPISLILMTRTPHPALWLFLMFTGSICCVPCPSSSTSSLPTRLLVQRNIGYDA